METWAPGITAIKTADLGDSPAAVNRETGVMYVNPDFNLDADQWYFIMLHEMGHLVQQTKDELTADAWAHKQYLKDKNRSLKKSVFALTDLLQFNKSEDFARAKMQLKRAQRADTPNNTLMYTNTGKYYGHPKCDPNYATYFTGLPSFDTIAENPSLIDRDKMEYLFGLDDALVASAGSVLGGLFGGPADNWGANAIQYSTPAGAAVSMIPDWHRAADILFKYPQFQSGVGDARYLEKNARKGQADAIGQLILQTDPSLFVKIGVPQGALGFLQQRASSIFGGSSSNSATPGAPGSASGSNNTMLIVGIAIAVVVVVVGVVLAIRKR